MIDLRVEARKVFGLTFPFSDSQLKSAFREAAKRLHPDTSGSDGEMFIVMKKLYDVLLSEAQDTSKASLLFTVDGTPLPELGKGLGSMKNGVDCPKCNHKGFFERKEMKWGRCWGCQGKGFLRRGGFVCLYCFGTGTVGVGEEVRVYYKCSDCGGTGEKEVMNPVIPKGRLANLTFGKK